MTLERHRSHLIPDVAYSLDGTVFVTDTGGTFPLRGKGKQHHDIRDHGYVEPGSPPSFHSYDPRRDDAGKRKYKQRPSPTRMADEVRTISGNSTISTRMSSSLGRRLRRSKRLYSSARAKKVSKDEDKFRFKDKGYGSLSAGSNGRRLRAGTPRMPPEFAENLRRQKEERASRQKKSGTNPGYGMNGRDSLNNNSRKYRDVHRESNGSIKPWTIQRKERLRKIHDEKLPYVIFLVDGIFLIVIGIIRMILSHWHEFFSPLWTGLLALIFGIIGAKHHGLYLAKNISAAYILFGFIVSIAMLATSGIVLNVLVPTLTILGKDGTPQDVVSQVTFTKMNKTITTLELSQEASVWTGIALDLGTVVLIFVGLFAFTAAMIALSNHWDASYDTTADCDHRGNPRLFNPIEQSGLGEGTVFVGLLYIAALDNFNNVTDTHFYLPVVAGALVMVTGVISFCFGKRTDALSVGSIACFFELLSLVACGGATILTTLNVASDATTLIDLKPEEKDTIKYNELLAAAVIGGAMIFVLGLNVVFIVGITFRQFRQLCCRRCCDRRMNEAELDPYNRKPSRFEAFINRR